MQVLFPLKDQKRLDFGVLLLSSIYLLHPFCFAFLTETGTILICVLRRASRLPQSNLLRCQGDASPRQPAGEGLREAAQSPPTAPSLLPRKLPLPSKWQRKAVPPQLERPTGEQSRGWHGSEPFVGSGVSR